MKKSITALTLSVLAFAASLTTAIAYAGKPAACFAQNCVNTSDLVPMWLIYVMIGVAAVCAVLIVVMILLRKK